MSHFAIAAAQVASVRGDIERNLATHAAAMAAAAAHGVAVLVFPELSLIGYEPDLAAELAMTPTDGRLEPLRQLARDHRLVTMIGVPLKSEHGKPTLGAILLGPDDGASVYAKMTLGSKEQAFFVAACTPSVLVAQGHSIGLSICADASDPDHPQTCAALGATIYVAAVFLDAEWYRTDLPRYPRYAARHRMLTVVANHAASIGTLVSVGKSAIWSPQGALLAEAPGTEPALVIATWRDEGWHGDVIPLPEFV